jgi:hypothetical protein
MSSNYNEGDQLSSFSVTLQIYLREQAFDIRVLMAEDKHRPREISDTSQQNPSAKAEAEKVEVE